MEIDLTKFGKYTYETAQLYITYPLKTQSVFCFHQHESLQNVPIKKKNQVKKALVTNLINFLVCYILISNKYFISFKFSIVEKAYETVLPTYE